MLVGALVLNGNEIVYYDRRWPGTRNECRLRDPIDVDYVLASFRVPDWIVIDRRSKRIDDTANGYVILGGCRADTRCTPTSTHRPSALVRSTTGRARRQ